MSGGTPTSSVTDDSVSSDDSVYNAAESVSGEPRSNDKLDQIQAFAQKYGINVDADRDTPGSLNLDDVKLDDIEVNVPMPKLLKFDADGARVSDKQARETQQLEYNARVREARERVVRLEFKELLSGPDFMFINSNPSNLVANDGARSSNDEAAPAAMVPTPLEQQQGIFNHVVLPKTRPPGFDPTVLQDIFEELILPSEATDEEYARILNARCAKFIELLNDFKARQKSLRQLIKNGGPDQAFSNELKAVHAYLGSIQANLEHLNRLKRSRTSKKELRAQNNATANNNNNSNNNNNNGASFGSFRNNSGLGAPGIGHGPNFNNNGNSRRPVTTYSVSHDTDKQSLTPSARRRQRKARQKAMEQETLNYNYSQSAQGANNANNNNNNNHNNNNSATRPNSDDMKSAQDPPLAFGPNQPANIRQAQVAEFNRNREAYDAPNGDSAAAYTAVLLAKADQLRAQHKQEHARAPRAKFSLSKYKRDKDKCQDHVDSDLDHESDHTPSENEDFIADFRSAHHVPSWIVANLRNVRDFGNELFDMAWWCALRELDTFHVWVAYLQLNGWTVPKELDDRGLISIVTPVMDGHFLLTKLAIDLLMSFWAIRRPGSDFDPGSFLLDQARLYHEINMAQAHCHSKYRVATALATAARVWNGKKKYLYKLFRREISKFEPNPTIYSFDSERSDMIQLGAFRGAKGCVPEKDYATLAAEAEQRRSGSKSTLGAKKEGEGSDNNYNNSNDNNNNDCSGYRGNGVYNPYSVGYHNDYAEEHDRNYNHFGRNPCANNNNHNIPDPGPNQRGRPIASINKNNSYAERARDGGANNRTKPSYFRGYYRSTAERTSPSGAPYPPRNSVPFPTTDRPADLFAPKLHFFARLFQLPREPNARDYGEMTIRLGTTPLNYCSDFNARGCERRYCVLHHLCEWCASNEHGGNDCPYRPAGMHFRRTSPHYSHQNRGHFDEATGEFIAHPPRSRRNRANRANRANRGNGANEESENN